ncbi:MAG: Gfo/Idh/MocA family oxidoreductase [Pedobacter sp.]|jgi:predicted dehydrogenase|uniref:Gfo/Idh/MocA family protein n=1 Tax=Pedobacter sp. TaxID=1411316 RepID=UPI00356B2DAA
MNTKQTLNWGIIGCGDVTEVKSGPAFNNIPNSRLYAIMRRNAEKAADYAMRHGVPVWYSSAHDLINDPEVNAIYIATPPSTHELYTIEALKAGKPVYVEKPMALSAQSCKRMAATAEEYGIKLTVAHYRRAMPYFSKVKELITEIGDLRFVSIRFYQPAFSTVVASSEENWRVDPEISGGGLFHDLAPHHIDLLNWFFGSPTSVNGFSANQSQCSKADNIVSALLTYGTLPVTGTWCFDAPMQEDLCEIVGSRGSIRFAFHGNKITLNKDGKVTDFPFIHSKHVQEPMIAAVVGYFTNEIDTNPCAAEEGIKTMQIIDELTGNKFTF